MHLTRINLRLSKFEITLSPGRAVNWLGTTYLDVYTAPFSDLGGSIAVDRSFIHGTVGQL